MPFVDSGMRVMELLAWPNTNMALTLSFCSTWSFGSSTASNQRVERDAGSLHHLLGCLGSKRD